MLVKGASAVQVKNYMTKDTFWHTSQIQRYLAQFFEELQLLEANTSVNKVNALKANPKHMQYLHFIAVSANAMYC